MVLTLEKFSSFVGRAAGWVLRRFYVYVTVIEFSTWKPRLERFSTNMRLVEVTEKNSGEFYACLPPKSQGELDEWLPQGARYFVVEKAGELAGIIGGRRQDKISGISYCVSDDELILHHLWVDPKFRKGATAGVVAELVFRKLENEGLSRIFGTISSFNVSSLVFSQNLGWKQHAKYRVFRCFGRFNFASSKIEGLRDTFIDTRCARHNRKKTSSNLPSP